MQESPQSLYSFSDFRFPQILDSFSELSVDFRWTWHIWSTLWLGQQTVEWNVDMSNEHAIMLTDGYGIVRYQPKRADLGVSPICKVVACQGECQPLPKILLITYTFHSRSFREGVKKTVKRRSGWPLFHSFFHPFPLYPRCKREVVERNLSISYHSKLLPVLWVDESQILSVEVKPGFPLIRVAVRLTVLRLKIIKSCPASPHACHQWSFKKTSTHMIFILKNCKHNSHLTWASWFWTNSFAGFMV